MSSFVSRSTNAPCAPSSSSTKSSSIPTGRRSTTKSLAWSLVCSLVLFNFVSVLSPSITTGAQAALTPGFCGDCQTFATSMQTCGGSFVNTDIEIAGEYVLQQAYAKCICTDVMQKLLWTCAKCEVLAGFAQAKAPPPQKYQTQCMAWGITIQEWRAPYTGPVAPGTQTDVTGGGGTNPSTPSNPTTAPSTPNPSGGNGGNGGSTPAPDGSKPSGTGGTSPTSSDNAESGGSTSQSSSGLNTTAVGISVGIIGVALVAGIFAVVVMKRRRRRHTPLDLDSLPGQGGFVGLEDKWEKPHPASPGLPPAPVASAPPMMGGRGGHRGGPYEGGHGGHGGYEGSAVGGYDPQYDNYDQYRGGNGSNGGAYDGYGQYPNQYGAEQQQYVGYHPNQGHERYPSHDYNNYPPQEKSQYM